MARGNIEAKLRLSTVEFSKNLKAATTEAVQAAAKMRAAFSQPLKLPDVPKLIMPPVLKLPPVPTLPTLGRPRGGDPEAKRQQEEIRGIANATNALKVAYEQGKVTQEQFVLGMRAAVATAEKLRKGYVDDTAAYGRLTNVIGIGARALTTAAGETSKLGLSQQVAIGSTRNLTDQLTDLQGTLLPLVGVAGLGGLVSLTSRLATEANRVNVAQDILNLTLDRTGQSGESAQQAITGVANELGLAEGQIVDYITQLVRVGFTTEQAQQALIAGGASALAFGKTAAVGVESVAGALVTQNSALLNTIGISENIGKVMTDAAAANREYGEDAANAAAAQAGLEVILKATRGEVDSLDRLMSGLAGSQSEAAATAFNVRQEFGEMLIPLETLRNEALTGVLKGFQALPGTAQAGAASFGAVTLGVGGLATGLTALRPLLAATFVPPAGAVVLGIAVLAGMTSGLVALARAAQTNVTPLKTLSQNTDVTRKAIGNATDKESLAGAVEAFSTQLDGKGREALRNYAQEVRNAKGDIDDLKESSAGIVTNAALDQAIADRAKLQNQLATVPAVQDADPNKIVADLQDRLNRSAQIQNLGVQLELGIVEKDGQLAVKVLSGISENARVGTEATNLLLDSFKQVNVQINQAAKGAAPVLRQQISGLDKTIADLRESLKAPLAVPEPTATYNPQVIADLEAQLQETQDLRAKIDSAANDLAGAEADAAGDVIKRLQLQFVQGEREIVRGTNGLIAEVQGQFDRGLIGQAEAQTQVDELQRQGFARLELNEKTYTDGVQTELNRRKEVVRTAQQSIIALQSQDTAAGQRAGGDEAGALKTELDAQLAVIRSGLQAQLNEEGRSEAEKRALRQEARAQELSAVNTYHRSLADLDKQHAETARREAEASAQALADSRKRLNDATLANVDGGIPQLIVQFAEERQVRRDAFEEQLEDFEGSASERAELVANFNRSELQLSLTHNRDVKQQQDAALSSYLGAVRSHNRDLAQARQEAVQKELQNLEALNRARVTTAQNRLGAARDGGDVGAQVAANNSLLATLQEGVVIAAQQTQAARDRKATGEELIGLLGNEASAQRTVTDAIEQQIEALKAQREEQEGIIGSGGQLVDLLQNVSDLTGDPVGGQSRLVAIQGLEQEEAALVRLLQRQREQGATLTEQNETLNKITANLEAQKELGGSGELSAGALNTVRLTGAGASGGFGESIREAEQNVLALDEAIAKASAQLVAAGSQLQGFLDAAASEEGVDLKVKVKVDRTAVDNAKKALREALGAEAGERIINQSERAGTKAGKGLLSAFAKGLLDNRAVIRNAVATVLQEDVRNQLPSSPAKYGPLSDIDVSGGRTLTTFAAGMRKQFPTLRSMTAEMAAIAKPALAVNAIPTSRPSYGGGAAGAGGSVQHNYTMQIDGRQASVPTGILSLQARQLAEIAVRELKIKDI